MPIRFRCAYCNQLMGIASRKAGTVVRCPKCAGEIIVPSPESPEPPPGPTEQAAGPQVFEDLKFDQFINPPANGSAGPPAESAPVAVDMPPPAMTAPILPPKRLGLFLPLGMLIVSMLVVILLLILVFILGLIIGKHHLGTPDTKTAHSLPGGCSLFSGNVKKPQCSA
jgi:DNA-directed RNA polymerase subunit RPC12/RpoP